VARESNIFVLAGVTDGANRVFTAPSAFYIPSFRLIWNGQVYEPDDVRHGWSPLDTLNIETFVAPRAGDVLQAFYKELTAGGGDEIVIGSPFHPTDLYP